MNMHDKEILLDLGSHSAKVYRKKEKIELIDVVTWELLENKFERDIIERQLDTLLLPWIGKQNYRIKAIGTAAMRRNPIIAKEMQDICDSKGINYRVISQNEEAILIKKAIEDSEIPLDLDVLNVGGGSIQILTGISREKMLLNFGISDLNQLFKLTEEYESRKIDECIEWVYNRLPSTLRKFAYTGGERTYIQHFGISLSNGYCSKDDFTLLAQSLAKKSLQDLTMSSPFDSNWMKGAIASNCIVLAALKRSKSKDFFASDLNIAHGFLNLV
ncbi:Ppx/GppA phosphatase family protein [Bacillus mycoides]|uniref:Ppx/GppA phosphatase family protein n=1 Tax=Bacillus mycoides TaxID=1405 RepID=UPI001E518E55|nr:hypothetical protein [Bacillus mycoides]